LTLIQSADASNFAYNEELNKEPLNADTSSAPAVDLTKQPQGITGETVIQNVPGAKNIPGNSGATGIQNIIQYNSQSAARAPKNNNNNNYNYDRIKEAPRLYVPDSMRKTQNGVKKKITI
jgi:type 1 fimbria pilin